MYMKPLRRENGQYEEYNTERSTEKSNMAIKKTTILEQHNNVTGNNHVGMGTNYELKDCVYQPMPTQPYGNMSDMNEGGNWV